MMYAGICGLLLHFLMVQKRFCVHMFTQTQAHFIYGMSVEQLEFFA